jgi:hypothetical protein
MLIAEAEADTEMEIKPISTRGAQGGRSVDVGVDGCGWMVVLRYGPDGF